MCLEGSIGAFGLVVVLPRPLGPRSDDRAPTASGQAGEETDALTSGATSVPNSSIDLSTSS